MRALTERPRRCVARGGAACEEPPRLWGEEPVVVAAPPAVGPPAPARAPAPASALTRASSGPTLDDLVSGAWAGLSGPQAASCPVCVGPMVPRWSAGAGVVGGHCGDCGTTLE